MPFKQVNEFDSLNSYLREVDLGTESIKGELNTFVWENDEESWEDHFFKILEDMYPIMPPDLINDMWFEEKTWDDFKKDVDLLYQLDLKWLEDKSFYTTLEEALNKVVKAQESEIHHPILNDKIVQALEDDVVSMMLYFFYNTKLKHLVCVKIGRFRNKKSAIDEDEEPKRTMEMGMTPTRDLI